MSMVTTAYNAITDTVNCIPARNAVKELARRNLLQTMLFCVRASKNDPTIEKELERILIEG